MGLDLGFRGRLRLVELALGVPMGARGVELGLLGRPAGPGASRSRDQSGPVVAGRWLDLFLLILTAAFVFEPAAAGTWIIAPYAHIWMGIDLPIYSMVASSPKTVVLRIKTFP
jgi:hypothetical protein